MIVLTSKKNRAKRYPDRESLIMADWQWFDFGGSGCSGG